MKMNRLIKRKNLFALLFAVLLALPMCAILGRVLYTQWNKNAKDSYSDNYLVKDILITTSEAYNSDLTYNLTFKSYWTTGNTGNYRLYYLGMTPQELNITQAQFDNIAQWQFVITNSRCAIIFKDINTQQIKTYYIDENTAFSFRSEFTQNLLDRFYITRQIYGQNTLDNAFEYSVNQFIEDNNFGKLDFFQWFDNMFLDSNNSVNNMYVHFVNWYLNYALLISLAYILFLVLMWFINYVRKLLERGMDFGEGSY